MKIVAVAVAVALLAPMAAAAQTDDQLRLACKQFIEQSLHDPRDANLEWTKGKVTKDKRGFHLVQIRGRAMNQFGALRMATFECAITYTPPADFRAIGMRAKN